MSGISLKNKNFIDGMRLFEEDRKVDPDFIIETLKEAIAKTGEKTIEEVGEEAFQMLIDVLSGKMTKNEALGYFGSMDIWCMGPVI